MRLRYSTIEKANFKLIENELSNFHYSKNLLEELKEEIINGKGIAPEIRGSGISKPTESKAMRLLSSIHILEMQKRINAIESVLKELPSIKLELIEEKYFKHTLTNFGIMQKLNIEQATYYRYRREIIELIADRLGWLI